MKLYKYSRLIIVLFFSALGLYLRYDAFAHRNPSEDELFSIKNATGPLPHFWQRLSVGKLISFPGHYLSLWPFGQIFGSNKWGLAIPHIVAAVVGFYILYLICRRYFRTPIAYLITFSIVCFNSPLIFASFELRPYGVLATLALACFYLSDQMITKIEDLSLIKNILLGAFFVFMTIYQAYGLFIECSCFLFFILNKRKSNTLKQDWLTICRFLLPILLLNAFLFLWFGLGNPHVKSYVVGRGIFTFQYIPNPVTNLAGFLKGVWGNLIGNNKLYFLLFGALVPFLLPDQDRYKQIGFLLLVVIVPIEFILLLDLWGHYWFVQRQFVWAVPLFAFYLGWCWDSLLVHFGGKLGKQYIITDCD